MNLQLKADDLLTSKQVADQLKCKEGSLRLSRMNGKLYGIMSPSYIKIGSKVFYDKNVIKKWMIKNAIEMQKTNKIKNNNI